MKDKEEMSRTIGLAFDLLSEVVNNPDLADVIPDGSTVRFVLADGEQNRYAPLVEYNRKVPMNGFDYNISFTFNLPSIVRV